MIQRQFGGTEDALADLIDDPVFRLILRRDGVTEQDVLSTLKKASKRSAKILPHLPSGVGAVDLRCCQN